MDEIEAVDCRLWFEEVDGEAPEEIGGDEDAEEGAVLVRAFAQEVERDRKQQEEENLVELGGVAGDAVAEVDRPGERGGDAVGVVGEAGEEAADAADGDAEAEWDGEEIAGAGFDVEDGFDEFDGEPAAEGCVRDRPRLRTA